MPSLLSLTGPLLLAGLLAVRGLRKRSLSPSGAVAAFIVGFVMMSVPLRVFGVSMIAFYLVGSRATKAGNALKRQLEEGHDGEGEGHRSAWQVLCNSFTAAAASALWAIIFSPGSLHATVSGYFYKLLSSTSTSSTWCDVTQAGSFAPMSRALILAALGHFACCLGDTLASELGILSKSPPRLVTAPWRHVPPGTNGGMSTYGTFASFLGGLLIGAVMALDLIVERGTCFINPSIIATSAQLVCYGSVGGVFGSLVDSLLGATLQQTKYSKTSRLILQDGSLVQDEVSVISGINVLTNNQVNFVSSLMTASLFGLLSLRGAI